MKKKNTTNKKLHLTNLRRPTRRNVFVWISLALLLILALPVAAHGYIVRAIPEDRAVLQHAPTQIQYWFSENLEPQFSSLIVRDQVGNIVAQGGVDPNDYALLETRLPPNLANGAYVADLRTAFASDGHVVDSSQVFFVGTQAGNIAEQSSGNFAVPLEVVWRVILLSSITLLLGVFALYSLVLVPAWGSTKYPAGLLPPRVMTRLNWIVGIALVVAFAGNILALLQQTMTFFNADIGRVISQQLYTVVRIGTRFGDTWNVRIILLLILAALFAISLYFRERQPEIVRASWVASVWVVALIMGTFSVASHAAGSLLLPWFAVISDWLHGMSVGFWAGGVAALALVAPVALKPYTGDQRRQALLAALRRFTRVATAGLFIVITTGIYSALNWFTSPNDLVSSYGGALLLKLILVALLVIVGAAHHVATQPERYQRWSNIIARVDGFIPTLRLEAVLVLAVLVAVAYLSATPIPQPNLAGLTVATPTATQTVGNYTLTTTITPGGPGINTYDVLVEQGGKPVDDLNLSLRMDEPSRDYRSDWHALESIGGGEYTSVGDEIVRPGEWWTEVNLGQTHAAFDWNISDDASVISSRPPTILNWLALAAVIASLGYAAYPLLHSFYKMLDLRPEFVLIAVGSLAVSIAIIVVAVILIQQSNDQVDLQTNPPAKIVNAELPTEASLSRGQALYETACKSWQGNTDVQQLIQRLPRTRDEDLYAAVTSQGWWSLPACQGNYSAAQWWDVVNYLRSLQPVSG